MGITTSYFVYPIDINSISGSQAPAPANLAKLNRIILVNEKYYLIKLLGQTLYDAYIATPANFTALTAKLYDTQNWLSPIADYIYYRWAEETNTYSTGGGEVKGKHENSDPVMNMKALTAYNRSLDKGIDVLEWMMETPSDYPNFDPDLDFFSRPVNSFGI